MAQDFGVHNDHGQAGLVQGVGHRNLVAPGGFQQYGLGVELPQAQHQASNACSLLDSEKWRLAGRESTSRCWEDTSMPTKSWGVSMFLELPSLQMRARGPGDCSGLLQGDVAARLRNGLKGPRVRRPTTSETMTTPGAGPGACPRGGPNHNIPLPTLTMTITALKSILA